MILKNKPRRYVSRYVKDPAYEVTERDDIDDQKFKSIHEANIFDYGYANGLDVFDSDFVLYAFNRRDFLIEKMNFDNSTEDLTRIQIIERIEKDYILPKIEFYVEVCGEITDNDLHFLKNFKPFKYTPNQKDNNYKLPKWGKELVKVLIKKGEIKHNDLVIELEKKGSFPQSYCGNLTKIFKTENAKEFLKKEISHSGYWKLNNPEKMKELSSN